jgi:diguanylate cyclase (GGDEF)-like protein/PAS domain S-box-containing protein
MHHPIRIHRLLAITLRQLSVAVGHGILVWVSLSYLTLERGSGGLFLASGFALAMLLLSPGYIGAIFFGAIAANGLFGYPLETVLLLSVGRALGAYLGAWLLSRDRVFDAALLTARDYLLLVVYGGIGSIVSSGIGIIGLFSGGILTNSTGLDSLFYEWLMNLLGVIFISPLILLWAHPSKETFSKRKTSEVLWAVITLFLAGQMIFSGWLANVIGYRFNFYWLALPIGWAVLRLGKHWVAAFLALAAMQAALAVNSGMDFFVNDISLEPLGNRWLIMVSLALASMLLSIYIEQRQQVEIRLRQQAEELNFRNQVLQQINRGASLPLVVSGLIQAFEHLHSGCWCAILLLDKDGKHLRYGAAINLPDFYKQAINGLLVGEGVGACGAAVRRGERFIISAMQRYTFWPVGFRFRDAAKKAGIQSWWSQPIKNREHRVLGTFDIYHPTQREPSPEDIDQMERMAHLAAQMIEQASLQEGLHLKDMAFNVSSNAMAITDKDTRIQWANPAFAEMTGYAVSELIGLALRDLGKSEKQDHAYDQTIWKTILAGNSWHGELIHRQKNGVDYDEEMTITPIKDDTGNPTHFFAVMRNITERKKSEEQIRTLAFYDTLTQLPNRRLLDDRLSRAMIASKRSNRYGALMFLDLDNFKPLNDKYGHGTGDLLLIEVARRITQCVRGTDTVARFGGDEFVVILDGLSTDRNESLSEAEIVAEKIRRSVVEPFILSVHKEGRGEVSIEHRCSVSIGVALFIGDGIIADDLLKRADMAMYRAKDKGRNRIHFFDVRHI